MDNQEKTKTTELAKLIVRTIIWLMIFPIRLIGTIIWAILMPLYIPILSLLWLYGWSKSENMAGVTPINCATSILMGMVWGKEDAL